MANRVTIIVLCSAIASGMAAGRDGHLRRGLVFDLAVSYDHAKIERQVKCGSPHQHTYPSRRRKGIRADAAGGASGPKIR